MIINILITSVSRKVWLVKAFKDGLEQLDSVDGCVVSTDINPLSAGLYFSDKHYIVPSSDDDNFIEKIKQICRKENVSLIIPTRDGELSIFAENKKEFEEQGITVMVCDQDVVSKCHDKYLFYQFLINNGILTPETFLPNEIDFEKANYPFIIKSRCGSSSNDIYQVQNTREMKFFLEYVPDPIVQEFVEGKEYTIDVFSDFNGKVISIVTRERVETIGGESYKGKTAKVFEIINEARSIVERLGTIGHVTLQCIKKGKVIKFIECNPRYGGGAILGIKAGANTPMLLLKLIRDKKIESQIGQFQDDLIMLRYTDDFYINQ